MPHASVIRRAALALLSCSALVPAGLAAQHSPMKASELRADMRKLWEDHITWTRLYIVEATGNLPEKDATLQRLLKNQSDIGNAIKPFYGDAAGDKLTGLLKTHITVAGEIVAAAMQGDDAKKDDAAKRWTANADDIAVFLSGANPGNWPVEDLKHMLHSHLDLTTQEVTAHLQKKWEDDIEAYDKIHVQILQMADALAMGIAKQFPQKVAY